MNEIRIGNDLDAQLVLDKPKFRADGWLSSYRVSLRSSKMNAEVIVDNAPYGDTPVEFFETLNDNWKGWEGEKSWGALEGEYWLSATISKTGHVTLTACLNVNPYLWTAAAKLDIEAGQLEVLKNRVRRFFGYTKQS